MTIGDLAQEKFLKGRRIRQDLDWLLTVLPHCKPGALIHILVNKIDEQIRLHTEYGVLVEQLAKELRSLDKTVNQVLHPYESRYTGATLISMKDKQIYCLAIDKAFSCVFPAFHANAADENHHKSKRSRSHEEQKQ